MTTENNIVALTLHALDTFKRRDLNLGTGVPVVVRKGETIGVTPEVAEQLLDEDNVLRDSDYNTHPYFVVAKEGTKLTYDFVTKPEVVEAAPKGTRTTTHDLSSLPETEQLSAEHVTSTPGKAVRSARSQRKSS